MKRNLLVEHIYNSYFCFAHLYCYCIIIFVTTMKLLFIDMTITNSFFLLLVYFVYSIKQCVRFVLNSLRYVLTFTLSFLFVYTDFYILEKSYLIQSMYIFPCEEKIQINTILCMRPFLDVDLYQTTQ